VISFEVSGGSVALILKDAFTKTLQVADQFASAFNPGALAVAPSNSTERPSCVHYSLRRLPPLPLPPQ